MSSKDSIDSLETQPYDETKPGLGQYYCIPCAKYFETPSARSHHQRGKVHKRRVKLIKEGPYTPEEANAAAGHDVEKFMRMKEERAKLCNGDDVQLVLAKPPKEAVAVETAIVEAESSTTDGDSMQIEEN